MNSKQINYASGFSPQKWEKRLDAALKARKHEALQQILLAMGEEMRSEAGMIRGMERSPLVDRLLEHSRRLFRAEPTRMEALENELETERRLWSGYRRKYRDVFIPESLHSFLDSSGVFLSPSCDGPLYDGFEKFFGKTGGMTREAVTLFHHRSTCGEDKDFQVPPNFFSTYDTARGWFRVLRAYRTDLPRGAGEECITEHVEQIVRKPDELKCLVFDNVQNSDTYSVSTRPSEDGAVIRDSFNPVEASLVRLGQRILRRFGLEPAGITAELDGFGFLDILVKCV